MAAIQQRYDAAVLGLGETGLACVRHLAARGARVAVLDTREAPPGAARLRDELPDVELTTGGLDPAVLAAADELVISPGIDPRLPPIRNAVAAGVSLIGELTLFRRATAAPVVAVTGSNGKSTVTKLAGELLSAGGWRTAVGGNLGTPALALLRNPPPDVYVLELSSFQLETVTELNATSAAVLNISADHLDRYADIGAYAAAKARILTGAGSAVVNADDPMVVALAESLPRVTRFGLGAPAGDGDFGVRPHDGAEWLVCGDEPIMPAAEVALAGRHNLANVLAALALAAPFRPAWPPLRAAVGAFRGLAHRGAYLGAWAGVRWVDDSKATNVGAALAAIRGCNAPVVLIAGGRGKGQDFSALAEGAGPWLRGAVLIGADAEAIGIALASVCPVQQANDMPAAVAAARAMAGPGDTVLLAPACDSLDMFRDYAARGDAFCAAVAETYRG